MNIKKLKKIVLLFCTVLIALPLWSQRKLGIKLISRENKQLLIVKYKGNKGDFFDPITTDFIYPNTPKDSVRLINGFDTTLSGVLFFLSKNRDSILYQVWDVTKIESKDFDKFIYSIYDYTNCISFKRNSLKLKLPVSLNPILRDSNLTMIYRIEIKKGICGETIEWLEAKVEIRL